MKKKIIFGLLTLALSFSVFAGDVASFDEIGFSEDGKYFVFGQYGKQDVTYKAWAEIYTVDVAENDYVKGEVYKSKSVGNDESSGKKCYNDLKEKSEWKLSKYNCKPSDPENLLYVRKSEDKNPEDVIKFKDYDASDEEKSVYFCIKLVPTYEGKGKNVVSKYYIDVKKVDDEDNVLASYTVGTPDFKRKGISCYQIDKIFTDKDNTCLVFIISKTLEDDTGTSIRYMIETYKF